MYTIYDTHNINNTNSINNTKIKEIYVAEWDQTKWLVLSSLIFSITTVYAYYNKLYYHFFILLCLLVSSINYWRKATYSLRGQIYIIAYGTSYIIFFIDGLIYLRSIKETSINIYLISFIIRCYYSSLKAYKQNNDVWYMYYILAQTATVYSHILILDCIANYNNNILKKST